MATANGEMRKGTRSCRRCASPSIAVSCIVLLLASTVSCARSFRNPFGSYGPPAPEILTQGASLQQVVDAVNMNAAKIQSYQSNDASISVPGLPAVPNLRGNIAAMRPGRIRLQASTALTGNEVDLGANDELFWSWVKRSEPPAVYFARHDQYNGSQAQQLIPIEPQWLLDALGFAQLNPADVRQGPTLVGSDRIELVSQVATRSGPLTKRTVIDARRAWVLEQYVYNPSGQLVAQAIATDHRYYPESGVSLPQKIDIRIPTADLAMSINVGTVTINALVDNPQLWTMPVIAGSPAVDLGASSTTAVAQPLGGQIAGADWNKAPAGTTPIGPAPLFASPPAYAPVASGQALTPSSQTQFDPFMPTPPSAQRLPAGGVSAEGAVLVR